MKALTTSECFITIGKVHKVYTIILHTTQVTQATSFPETKPKWILKIGYDHFTPNMAIIFLSMPCI
jgi:hypothetical protein